MAIRARSADANGLRFRQEWSLRDDETPPLAAHVVTVRRGYTHHGIYVGKGQVVHYAGLCRGWHSGPVEEVSLASFARGNAVSVRPHLNPRFDCQQIVARAYSRLGENRYQLMSNNCEHFTEWCVQGESRSHQVEALRHGPRRALAALIGTLRSGLREFVKPAPGPGGWAV